MSYFFGQRFLVNDVRQSVVCLRLYNNALCCWVYFGSLSAPSQKGLTLLFEGTLVASIACLLRNSMFSLAINSIEQTAGCRPDKARIKFFGCHSLLLRTVDFNLIPEFASV